MSVDSFGYQVMSLNELIEELTARRDADPQLGDKPVWLSQYFPHPPVLRVGQASAYGLALVVQRGYDQ